MANFNVTKSIPLQAMLKGQWITSIKSLDKSEFEGKDPKTISEQEVNNFTKSWFVFSSKFGLNMYGADLI